MSKITPVEILLVEDNAREAELMINALENRLLANRIEVIDDGSRALDFLLHRGDYEHRSMQGNPRVVFLDLKLKGIDGLAVLKEIRAGGTTKTLPVVIVSAHHSDEVVKEAYRLGANSFVVKPTDIHEYTRIISGICTYWIGMNEPPK
jgi:CheY-like chemotaxis protein